MHANTANETTSYVHHLDGSDIVITGVLGFIGSYTLAKVLHTIPKSGKLFVLIRAKREMSAQDRLNELVAKHATLFERADMSRVHVVEGDCMDLSTVSKEDIHKMKRVRAFIHIAASVDWTLPYEEALKANDVTKVYIWARKNLPGLKSFIQTSTAYSSPMSVPIVTEEFDPDYEVNRLNKDAFANSYTWSKYIAEHELRKIVLYEYKSRENLKELRNSGSIDTSSLSEEEQSLLNDEGCQVAIVRPGIVGGALGTDEFAPAGWNLNMNTINGSFLVYGAWNKNLIWLTPMNKHNTCNVTPVDIVSNVLILTSAKLLSVNTPTNNIRIVNCVQTQENTTTWGNFMKIFSPNPKELIYVKSKKEFDRLFKLFVEIPSRFIPNGKYKTDRLRAGLEIMLVFTLVDYKFKTDNLRALDSDCTGYEKRNFPIYFKDFCYHSYITSCFQYAKKNIIRSKKDMKSHLKQRKTEVKLARRKSAQAAKAKEANLNAEGPEAGAPKALERIRSLPAPASKPAGEVHSVQSPDLARAITLAPAAQETAAH